MPDRSPALRRVDIVDGHGPELIAVVGQLIREYSVWLDIAEERAEFEAEIAALPGKFAPPAGAVLLAYVDAEPAGCVAFRPLSPGVCEMKRLWLRNGFRGLGVARQLVSELLVRAQSAGYGHMRLDTLPHLTKAQALYAEQGFHEIPPYYATYIPGTLFLEKRL